MSCGKGVGLAKFGKKIDAAKDKVGNLIEDATEGLGGALDSLNSEFDDLMGDIGGGLKEMLPTIEMPEIPGFSLDGLSLPELPIPKMSLQLDIMSLVGKPLGPDTMAAFAELKKKYGDVPGVDFDKLQTDLFSGKINLDNLCKQVPNIECDKDGNVKEKGQPSTAAEGPPPEANPLAKAIDASAGLLDVLESPSEKLQLKIDKELIADLEGKIDQLAKEQDEAISQLGFKVSGIA
tara:strand:- start:185 stop:889 length:705 start_codon:yes stop_codon:yes gene_type:complete